MKKYFTLITIRTETGYFTHTMTVVARPGALMEDVFLQSYGEVLSRNYASRSSAVVVFYTAQPEMAA